MSVIEANQVVTFHYILRGADGELIDQSTPNQPLHYLHGHANIVAGLESQLHRRSVGDKLKVEVKPEQGYGPYDPEKCFLLERSQLGEVELEPGMTLELEAEDGETLLGTVVALDDEKIEIDANHPMAGKELFFEVEILGIRPASPEEIAHGHVHGPGGHHH